MGSDKKSNAFSDPEDWQNFTKYICESNRFILTDYWAEFIKHIVKTAKKRLVTLKAGTKLVRARNGTKWIRFEDGDEQPSPLSPHDMGPPPKRRAKEGRLNSVGIPYLYLATNIETAIAEIRPWIGSELTVGFFEILSNLKIVDTSNDETKNILSHYIFVKKNDDSDIKKRPIDSYKAKEKEEFIWGDINAAFSRPVSPSDTSLKYLPTQYLAEVLKNKGYDGIAYKSSLSEKGYNIALFNPDKAKCKWCRMYEVNQVKFDYRESGNPVTLSKDDKPQYQRITFLPPESKKDNTKASKKKDK